MPVANQHLALAQFVHQVSAGRHDAKLFVVVPHRRRFQHCQPALHRQPRRHHQNVFDEARVLRIGNLIEDMPGNRHCHYDGLAGAGGHLAALAHKRPAIAGDVNAHALGGGCFGEPDQRLNGFHLAEEKTPRLKLLRVAPMLQQPLGDAGYTGIARFTPRLYTRAYLVDQRNFHKDAGVVEGFGITCGHHISRRTATFYQVGCQNRREQADDASR